MINGNPFEYCLHLLRHGEMEMMLSHSLCLRKLQVLFSIIVYPDLDISHTPALLLKEGDTKRLSLITLPDVSVYWFIYTPLEYLILFVA